MDLPTERCQAGSTTRRSRLSNLHKPSSARGWSHVRALQRVVALIFFAFGFQLLDLRAACVAVRIVDADAGRFVRIGRRRVLFWKVKAFLFLRGGIGIGILLRRFDASFAGLRFFSRASASRLRCSILSSANGESSVAIIVSPPKWNASRRDGLQAHSQIM